MGTRADFYLGRDPKTMRWLGSCAYDGHAYEKRTSDVSKSTAEKEYIAKVLKLTSEDDGTSPEDGWPWPWETSQTTDYAYALDGGKVWVCQFGSHWRPAWPVPGSKHGNDDAFWDEWWGDSGPEAAKFPSMDSSRMATPGSHRSGVLLIG